MPSVEDHPEPPFPDEMEAPIPGEPADEHKFEELLAEKIREAEARVNALRAAGMHEELARQVAPLGYPDAADIMEAMEQDESFRAGVAWARKDAIEKIEALHKPTQSGRYAEAGYNDHFNDGLDAAVIAIEES